LAIQKLVLRETASRNVRDARVRAKRDIQENTFPAKTESRGVSGAGTGPVRGSHLCNGISIQRQSAAGIRLSRIGRTRLRSRRHSRFSSGALALPVEVSRLQFPAPCRQVQMISLPEWVFVSQPEVNFIRGGGARRGLRKEARDVSLSSERKR
jgi:hypothetical protein